MAHAQRRFRAPGDVFGNLRCFPPSCRQPSSIFVPVRHFPAAVDRADVLCRRLPRPPLPVVVLGDATEV